VAPGAGDGEAEEGFAEDVDFRVAHLVADLFEIGGAVALLAEAEEAAGDGGFQVLAVGGEALRGKAVAVDVFAEKGVVGEVLIEGADDVVAVAPGFVLVEIELVAAGFGEADEVEPVAGPAFAVSGGGEEAVDDLFVGVGAGVVEEVAELGGGGGKAGEIKREAAEERGAAGGGGEREAGLLNAGVEKRVD
jgi:hypothetical protein